MYTENDFWVKYTLPSNKRVYARCSYSDQNEGMYIEMQNANNGILDQEYSSDDVLGMDVYLHLVELHQIVNDGFAARQRWQFKYNALATVRSTMKSVKLTLEWEHDIANTGYKSY